MKTWRAGLAVVMMLMVSCIALTPSCGSSSIATGESEATSSATPTKSTDVAQVTGGDSGGQLQARPDDRLYLLRTRGYPRETPLSQAVEDFNKEGQRNRVGQTQPPLTIEEVVAAIRDWKRTEESVPPDMYKVFQNISKTELMPKGSYIFFNSGTVSYNGYDIDAWHIYLRVGLDKYPDDLVGVPSYSRLIRQQYISSRPTKFP